MAVYPRSHECERARTLASAELDVEIDDLEAAFLRGHLRQCAQCRAFAGEVRAFTLVLRDSALVPAERPVVVPSRRRRFNGQRLRVGVAAAAVAVVGLGSVLATLDTRLSQESPAAPSRFGGHDVQRQLNAYRQGVLVARAEKGSHAPSAGPLLGRY